MASRGEHLVRADRLFVDGQRRAGPARRARLSSGVLDLTSRAAEGGGIEASLPDGSRRRIGFHRPDRLRSSSSIAGWRWSGWRRRGRSAGTRPGPEGEWSSPDPVPLFELFMLNADAAGRGRPGQGTRRAGINRARAPAARQWARRRRARTSPRITTSATTSTREWLDPSMTYSSARFAPGDDSGGGPAAQDCAAARPARSQARRPAAGNRLRLGNAWRSRRRGGAQKWSD